MVNLTSYAKINLGLQVLQKREDGFHNINTIFARLSLHDDISIHKADTLNVICAPSLEIPQEENLVHKAFTLFSNAFQVSESAKITIQKHIPNGAGLGGGSSNAASILRFLCSQNNIAINDPRVLSIATKIGSDVPYFLQDGLAIATGRGDVLSYFTCNIHFYVVLVFPNIHVSTPWAYNKLNVHPEGKPAKPFRDILLMGIADPFHLREYCTNDFETSVFTAFPKILGIKQLLYEAGSVFSLMSGSGSCVYGLFTSKVTALEAASLFLEEQTYVCTFV